VVHPVFQIMIQKKLRHRAAATTLGRDRVHRAGFFLV
jgi:hypothetical protein